jgi:hypothetical protein
MFAVEVLMRFVGELAGRFVQQQVGVHLGGQPLREIGKRLVRHLGRPVFGGDYHEVYLALLKERCVHDGLATDAETLNRQFRLHLHRGISYLATPNKIRGIDNLVAMAIQA